MKPVTVPSHAFAFCRYLIAALIWSAFLLHSIWMLGIAAAVLALSALLKVRRAPLIQLYSKTALLFYRSPEEVLDESAMRFAHILGTILAAICLGLIFVSSSLGWAATLVFAILKTISAMGYCPASKLFTCATNTTCCPATKKLFGFCNAGRIDHNKS